MPFFRVTADDRYPNDAFDGPYADRVVEADSEEEAITIVADEHEGEAAGLDFQATLLDHDALGDIDTEQKSDEDSCDQLRDALMLANVLLAVAEASTSHLASGTTRTAHQQLLKRLAERLANHSNVFNARCAHIGHLKIDLDLDRLLAEEEVIQEVHAVEDATHRLA